MDKTVLERSSRIVVDSLAQAQKLSRELMEFFGAPGEEGWKRVESLSAVTARGTRRASSDDITLFKSLGMGISDLALGMELYRRAIEQGLGREFPHPEKVAPKLRG